MNASPRCFDSTADCVDSVLARVGRNIVLAIPLGIGKPVPLVNEFYGRAIADPTLTLTIYTALSLARPQASSDLERRFLAPFVERVFGDTPELAYVAAQRAGTLPPNIRIIEFFLAPGALLHSASAQQDYLSANYTHVAREVLKHVNLIAQMVAARECDGRTMLSLSSNPDITLDLLANLPALRERGRSIITIAAINPQLPYMFGNAEVDAAQFDCLLEDAAGNFDLFCPPNRPINSAGHMIGLHASSLVKDGGTLQLGIGELGDAVVHSLQLRQQHNPAYRQALTAAGADEANAAPFDKGLYACSEMFVAGFVALFHSGILKRRVHSHAALQRGLNLGRISEDIDAQCLDWLLECGIGPQLSGNDFSALEHAGMFREGVTFIDPHLVSADGQRHAADISNPASRAQLLAHCLAPQLRAGVVLHGGFFLGPKSFYAALRAMPDEERRLFNMSSVDFVNQLYGEDSALRILQRQDARFINTTMMVTLLGAAVSDGLEDGRVVSGVGGQYNMVAMAHALPGARSILLLRSTRSNGGKVVSSIVWNYGHCTIPRHLRDIVVTEYGIADLRGKTDSEIIAGLLNIADSRFQAQLLATAKAAGKISRDYRIPDAYRRNTPQAIEEMLATFLHQALFDQFPFGSEFTTEERLLAEALKSLKEQTATLTGKIRAAMSALMPGRISDEAQPCLQRMGLAQPQSMREWFMRNLLAAEIMQRIRAQESL